METLLVHPEVFTPGKTMALESGTRSLYRCTRFLPKLQSAGYQFADGTEMGDSQFARALLMYRATILEGLKGLHEVYVSRGEEAFATELEKRHGTGVADAYLSHIRRLQQKHGTQAAVEAVETHLKLGEARTESLGLLTACPQCGIWSPDDFTPYALGPTRVHRSYTSIRFQFGVFDSNGPPFGGGARNALIEIDRLATSRAGDDPLGTSWASPYPMCGP